MKKDSFQSFIDLIVFDKSLVENERKIVLILESIQKLRTRFESLLRNDDIQKKTIVDLKKRVDEKELEMAELDEREKMLKERMSSISNDREYKSLKKELDGVQSKQYNHEKNLVSVWNDYSTVQKEYEQKQQSLLSERENFELEISAKEQEIKQLKVIVEEHIAARKAYESNIPADWLTRYDRMRTMVDDPVVPVMQDVCSVCFYHLSQQDSILVSGKQLVSCRGCYRLLYDPQAHQSVE